MRKKKKKHDDDHINESWLLPYSDLLTLLLALFIVLFSMSNVDAKKLAELSNSFNSALSGGTGVLNYYNPVDTEDPKKGKQKQGSTDAKSKEEFTAAQKAVQEKRDLQAVQGQLDTYIDQNNLSGSLQTTLTDEGLKVTILDRALFDSGSAEVKPDSMSLANELSQIIATNPPRKITVAGFTDNVPIHNARFDSNWDLSAMRAINFMKILLQNQNLNPENFSAQGYGEYKPVVPNDTPEGRAKNRRVEVMILPNVDLQKAKDTKAK